MKVTPQSIQKYIQEHWIGGVITLGAIIVVTLFHWFGVFDTIELNRYFDASNVNIHTFVPFHGTPLRKMCEDLGLIKPETLVKSTASNPDEKDIGQLNMPQYPPHEIREIRKTFKLYVKFPKNRWKEIERAKKNDAEGEKIGRYLKEEYLEKYMPKPDADPHGGAEDFKNLKNSSPGYKDGLDYH